MKKHYLILLTMIMITTHVTLAQENNNFYDDIETYNMEGPLRIEVTGEIEDPGFIDLGQLTKRSVIVKETLLASEDEASSEGPGFHGDTPPAERSNRFVGAYRYDGYSLFDILNDFLPDKKNKEEFNPIIDLYVEIVNDKGESVILSWGEIYYPNHLHNVIIATSVMRIVPSKTKELWPIPRESKLVVGHDLLTERNISSPSKIIVHSASRSFKVDRELDPLFSPSVVYHAENNQSMTIMGPLDDFQQHRYESVFYGRGRGIHSTTPFHGIMLKDILVWENEMDREKLMRGYFIIAAADGYRGVFTFSEIFNRNDQAEFLLIEDHESRNGGIFRIFPASDFFSDRAIKAVNEVWFEMMD